MSDPSQPAAKMLWWTLASPPRCRTGHAAHHITGQLVGIRLTETFGAGVVQHERPVPRIEPPPSFVVSRIVQSSDQACIGFGPVIYHGNLGGFSRSRSLARTLIPLR